MYFVLFLMCMHIHVFESRGDADDDNKYILITDEMADLLSPQGVVSKIETCLSPSIKYIGRHIGGYGKYLEVLLHPEFSNISDTSACEFHFDLLSYLSLYPNSVITIEASSEWLDFRWYCELDFYSSQYTCDGISRCLSDECNCESQDKSVFYCQDKSGCISLTQTCDGSHDCKDGSDECICEGNIRLKCSDLAFGDYCVSSEWYCYQIRSESVDKKFRDILTSCSEETGIVVECDNMSNSPVRDVSNPVTECLHNNFDVMRNSFGYTSEILQTYCRQNCSMFYNGHDWTTFCKNVVYDYVPNFLITFKCNETDESLFFLNIICDEKVDCINGVDEIGCPGRFYCSDKTSVEWVSEDKICDSVKDCHNGADECAQCDMGPFSTTEFLIRSQVVFVLTSISGLATICLNAYLGFKCYLSMPLRHTGELDKIIRLQLYFNDLLMGVYQCLIVFASLVIKSKGDYCIFDQEWRSSIYCIVLGIVFTFSLHGSLLSIALMSVTRSLGCVIFTLHIKISTIKWLSLILTLVNLINSIVPIVPSAYIQKVFRTNIFLKHIKDNPFISTNPLNFSLLKAAHDRVFHKKSNNIYQILKDLRGITSDSNILQTTEISYYGNTGLCIHNIFKNQKDFFSYKIAYLTIIIFLLLIVSGSYIAIIVKNLKSRSEIQNGGGQTEQSVSATTKVIILIGSQLFCWIPFIGTAIYYTLLSDQSAHRMVSELFALIVIPINSLLNPIFYSGLYKIVTNRILSVQWLKKIFSRH